MADKEVTTRTRRPRLPTEFRAFDAALWREIDARPGEPAAHIAEAIVAKYAIPQSFKQRLVTDRLTEIIYDLLHPPEDEDAEGAV